MNLSIYTSLYLVNQNKFPFEDALINFSKFASETVISICPSGYIDDSLDTIKNFLVKEKLDNIKIVVNKDISLDNPLADGMLKNTALQHCSNEIVISLDGDERIRLKDKYLWEQMGQYLLLSNDTAAFFVPSINLCGSVETFKDVSHKWYIHKRHFNGKKLERGVVNFAKNPNGTIQIDKSDSCELLLDGNLVPSGKLPGDYSLENIKKLNLPFVFHLWAVDLEQRIKQNTFWSPIWESRAGHSVNDILMKREELEKIKVYNHGLELW